MKVRRREFMHLLGSQGVGLCALGVAGCGDDGDGGSGSSGSSGSSGGPGGSSSGPGMASSSGGMPGSSSGETGADSTSSGGGSSDESSGGEVIDCDESWWMCDNFAPVEEHHTTDLVVEGTIPSSLQGVYVRNGPNPAWGPTGHWFLGDGMLHGLALSKGAAQWYRARYIETPILGEDPTSANPLDPAQHQANTALVSHAGRTLALNEAGLPYEFSRDDLSTVGAYTFDGALDGSMTAHPKIDPTTGQMVFFGYDLFDAVARVHHVDPGGALTRTQEVPLSDAVMMHDFQLTPNYVVLMDFPIVFDLDLALRGAALPFEWRPKNGARIGVLPRDGAPEDIQWIEVEVGYAFHTFNAYEDAKGRIVIDMVWYPEIWVTGPSDFGNGGPVVRYTVDPAMGSATRQFVGEVQTEFPQIDPRRHGLPYRYGYSVATHDETVVDAPRMIVRKTDFVAGAVESHEVTGDLQLGELTFVPDSPDAAEDEGWLVGYGYDGARDRSELVILDASDIAAGPVGRVLVPRRIPFGFHGAWFPGD